MNNSMMNTRFNLAICELHNKYIHGFDFNSDSNIKGHYLCMYVFNNNLDIYENEDDEEEDDELYINYFNINEIINLCKNYYNNDVDIVWKNHEYIRNYNHIISRANYIKPEIIEIFYLSGGESIAILKTFWIKIIQRAWKKVFRIRINVISKRLQLNSIKYREYTGKWPKSCSYLPSIKSLLN